MAITWLYNSKNNAPWFNYQSESPALKVDIGYESNRQGANVVYTPWLRIYPRETDQSGLGSAVTAVININGSTQSVTVASSLPISQWNQLVEKSFTPVTVNNIFGGTVSYKVTFTAGFGDKDGTRTKTISYAMAVPEPTSSISLINNNPKSATIRLTNQASTYTATVYCVDNGKFLNANGSWSNSQVKLSSMDITGITDSSFFSDSFMTKETNWRVTTYSGSTSIGETPYTLTFVLREADAKPTYAFYHHDNGSTTTLTGNNQKYIIGYTTLKARVNYTGAPVSDVKINGVSVENNVSTLIGIVNSPTVTMSCYSRGRTWEDTYTLSTISYTKPTITPDAHRPDGVDDNKVIIIANSGNWTNINFGAVANTLELQYRSRQANGSWSDYNPISGISTSGDSWSYNNDSFGQGNWEYTVDYQIQFKLKDKLSEVETGVINIPKSVPIADWGENDFHFHVPVTIDSTLDTPITLNGLDLWQWIQKVELFMNPPKPDIPDPIEDSIEVHGNTNRSIQLEAQPTKVDLVIPSQDGYGDTPTYTWTKSESGTTKNMLPPNVAVGNGFDTVVTFSERSITIKRDGRSAKTYSYKIFFN